MNDDFRRSLYVIAGASTWLLTQSLVWAIVGVALTWLVFCGIERGWWVRLGAGLRPRLAELLNRFTALWERSKPAAAPVLYDLVIGFDPETRRPDRENLRDLGHIGIYGQTRFGKTTEIHSLVYSLLRTGHAPADLRLTIVDPKRTDYAFMGALPHLLCPIARDADEMVRVVDVLIREMNRRMELFDRYARKHLCNDLDRYMALSGERLPWIVAVFDELADVVAPGSEIEAKLISLSKLCLGYGIQLVCGTQRPSAKVMNGELKSQFATLMSTYMANNREYGTVLMAPKEMYEQMPRVRGRFMVYSTKGWRFMQGNKIPDDKLVGLVLKLSGANRSRSWTHAPAVEPVNPKPPAPSWDGLTDHERVRMLRDYAAELKRTPTLTEIENRFQASRPIAVKVRRLAFAKAKK